MADIHYSGLKATVGMTCDYHAAWDDNGQPIGPDCGEPATHVILWRIQKAWSASCARHHTEEFFHDAPVHTVYTVEEFTTLGLG